MSDAPREAGSPSATGPIAPGTGTGHVAPPLRPDVVGGTEPPAPPKPGRARDVVLSAVLLIGTYVAFLVGSVFALLGIAFTDAVFADDADVRAGVAAVVGVGVVLIVIGLAATAATVLLQRMGRRTWWIPALSLGLTIAGWLTAAVLYTLTV